MKEDVRIGLHDGLDHRNVQELDKVALRKLQVNLQTKYTPNLQPKKKCAFLRIFTRGKRLFECVSPAAETKLKTKVV